MRMTTFSPIGTIHTQFTDPLAMPVQSTFAEKSMMAMAEIRDVFIDGLVGLEHFTHIILVYQFHQAKTPVLMQQTNLTDHEYGVFATRNANRPNAIGISIVELVKVDGNKIYFNHADMLDGSPLLDIKPFIPAFDHREEAGNGWLEKSIKLT